MSDCYCIQAMVLMYFYTLLTRHEESMLLSQDTVLQETAACAVTWGKALLRPEGFTDFFCPQLSVQHKHNSVTNKPFGLMFDGLLWDRWGDSTKCLGNNSEIVWENEWGGGVEQKDT